MVAFASQYDAALADNRVSFGGMYTYSYDDEGNRTARWVDEGDEELGTDDTDVTEYAWDHRNRLTRLTHKADYDDAAYTLAVDYVYLCL